MEQLIGLIFIAVLATFAGAELIGKVPPQLHTPLMSGSNAISGITIDERQFPWRAVFTCPRFLMPTINRMAEII